MPVSPSPVIWWWRWLLNWTKFFYSHLHHHASSHHQLIKLQFNYRCTITICAWSQENSLGTHLLLCSSFQMPISCHANPLSFFSFFHHITSQENGWVEWWIETFLTINNLFGAGLVFYGRMDGVGWMENGDKRLN